MSKGLLSRTSSFAKAAISNVRRASGVVSHGFATSENNKEPNQDFVGMGTSTSPDFIGNPEGFLKEIMTKASESLRDQKFRRSGTTCNITAIDKDAIRIISFGDSPTVISIKDENGKRVSVKATQDHKFSDPELIDKFKVIFDHNGVERCEGLAVPCLGHNAKAISTVEPRFYEYRFSHFASTAAVIGLDPKLSELC